MNKTEIVQQALAILTELDRDNGRGVPIAKLKCRSDIRHVSSLLWRLSAAGIVAWGPENTVSLSRPLADLTALEILQAIWGQPSQRLTFQVLYAASENPAQSKVLENMFQKIGHEEGSN